MLDPHDLGLMEAPLPDSWNKKIHVLDRSPIRYSRKPERLEETYAGMTRTCKLWQASISQEVWTQNILGVIQLLFPMMNHRFPGLWLCIVFVLWGQLFLGLLHCFELFPTISVLLTSLWPLWLTEDIAQPYCSSENNAPFSAKDNVAHPWSVEVIAPPPCFAINPGPSSEQPPMGLEQPTDILHLYSRFQDSSFSVICPLISVFLEPWLVSNIWLWIDDCLSSDTTIQY